MKEANGSYLEISPAARDLRRCRQAMLGPAGSVTAQAVAFAVLTLTRADQLIEWDCCNALSPLL